VLSEKGEKIPPAVLPGQVTVDIATNVEVEGESALPATPLLVQNYPNPFNSSTTIRFYLPRGEKVRLELFNVLGQQVAVLAEGTFPHGWNVISWEGMTSDGRSAPSGIYFYRFRSDNRTLIRKLALVK
jgi:hypothetical protein